MTIWLEMKPFLFITIIFSLGACSPKPSSKGTTKFVMGNLALVAGTGGGAYVQAIDKGTLSRTMIKLDTENAFSVPNSSYDMLFITFAGPSTNSGVMMCGEVSGLTVSSEITITVNVSEANCTQSLFAPAILELKKAATPIWNLDRWDLSHWGS